MIRAMHISTIEHLAQEKTDRAADGRAPFHPRDRRMVHPEMTREVTLAQTEALSQRFDVDGFVHRHEAVHFAPFDVKREVHRCRVQNASMSGIDLADERAARLRQARIKAGFTTIVAAAERFGWSTETLRQHENATRGYQRKAEEYAKAFKVSVTWLLHGVGPGPGDAQALEAAKLAEIFQRLDQADQDALMSVARSMDRKR